MSKPPETISLTHEEIEGLKQRITSSTLGAEDQRIMLAILSFNFWLQTQLARAQLSILRLKKIFGLPTEKKTLK